MKILAFFDPHISYVPPANRIDDYYHTCLNKIQEIQDIAFKNNCKAVLCTGDMFHLKSWIRNPYSMVADMADLFGMFKIRGIDVITTYGNHDLASGDDDSIQRQPLGILCRAAGIRLLGKDEPCVLDEDTVLTASPFYRDIDKNNKAYLPQRIPGFKTQLLLSHGSLIPTKPIWEDYTLYKDVAQSEADWIINGHLHRNYGVQNIGKTRIANVGSLTRATLSEDDLTRKPSVLIIDTKKNDYKIVELKSAPKVEKCFNLEKIEQLEKAEEEIDRLALLIKQESSEIEINSLDGIKQLVKELKNVTPEVKDMCVELLEKSEAYI